MIKRAARSTDRIRLPLLCDPVAQHRLAALGRAEAKRRAEVFADTLDPATLGIDLGGISHVTIRGLSGLDFQEADAAVPLSLSEQPLALVFAQQVERIRLGLAAMDDEPESNPYPVDRLSSEVGSLWPELRSEVAARIEAFSTLGESAGSSSAP